MKEKLAEFIAKAAGNPDAYNNLTITYQRGHDLSGITCFEMLAGGKYTLSSNNPRKGTSISLDGELDAEQRKTIFDAITETGLLDTPSSSRNINDDEQPVEVTLAYDDLVFQLDIWAGDARENTNFHKFETTLWVLLKELSDGGVGRGPV
ncbi:MAG: hypothetical protein JXA42_13315 [Anaerolineales bacterium]|nr:hypothetical protein [Anaerolineales bacterium]